MDKAPEMPTSQAEWEIHWGFYQITLQQRDIAWREIESLKSRLVTMTRIASS